MNIFVGNLNFKVEGEDLKEIFEEYGTVADAKVITDRNTGRSKGFGFVVMDNDTEANAAIGELNGATLESRQMVVNQARERKQYS